MALNFKLPVTTRDGYDVKLYEVFKDYANGAFLDDDLWKVCQWSMPNGYCLLPYPRASKYDLINNEPYQKET